MNILLVGGSCSLVDSLILKLRKEGHRVYILTGDKYKHNKYERVFEKKEKRRKMYEKNIRFDKKAWCEFKI